MCTGSENLNPAARALVGGILGQIAERLAREHGCQRSDVVIGPVDLGPDPDREDRDETSGGAGVVSVGDTVTFWQGLCPTDWHRGTVLRVADGRAWVRPHTRTADPDDPVWARGVRIVAQAVHPIDVAPGGEE